MRYEKKADVALVFAQMPLQRVEFLLQFPEDLRSTLKGVAAALESQMTVVAEGVAADLKRQGEEGKK